MKGIIKETVEEWAKMPIVVQDLVANIKKAIAKERDIWLEETRHYFDDVDRDVIAVFFKKARLGGKMTGIIKEKPIIEGVYTSEVVNEIIKQYRRTIVDKINLVWLRADGILGNSYRLELLKELGLEKK